MTSFVDQENPSKKQKCIIQFSWKPHYYDGRKFSGIWKEDKQRINISYFGTETWHEDKKNHNSVSEDTKTNLVILSGPSSAGKTYIAKEALENGILSNEHFPNNFLKIDGGDMRERSIIFNTFGFEDCSPDKILITSCRTISPSFFFRNEIE